MNQVNLLYKSRCTDLNIVVKEHQLKKFADTCQAKCIKKKLNLTNMFLGPSSALLLSQWILGEKIDITHFLLGQNNLGDKGVEILAPALAVSKQIVAVDLSQNGFTPKCASFISGIVSENESIIDLNLSSM